eukprot:9496631-Pyramimonas_sp.AAC.2
MDPRKYFSVLGRARTSAEVETKLAPGNSPMIFNSRALMLASPTRSGRTYTLTRFGGYKSSSSQWTTIEPRAAVSPILRLAPMDRRVADRTKVTGALMKDKPDAPMFKSGRNTTSMDGVPSSTSTTSMLG